MAQKPKPLIAWVPICGGPLDGGHHPYDGATSFCHVSKKKYGANVATYTMFGGPRRFVYMGRNLNCTCDVCRGLKDGK